MDPSGEKAIGLTLDLLDKGSISSLVSDTINKFGKVSVLVNAAMETRQEISAKDIDVLTMDLDTWKAIFGVNLFGNALMCQAVLPHMIKEHTGSIINIASICGKKGEPMENAYGCSKAGILQLTRSIATTYGKNGIRCNSILPGLIRHERILAALPKEILDMDDDNVLVDYHGEPKHIAGTVAFLASDDSAFITGEEITVDGGQLAHLPTLAQLNHVYPGGFAVTKDD